MRCILEPDFKGNFDQGCLGLDEQLLGAFHPHPPVDEGGGAFGFAHEQALELPPGEPDRCGGFLDRQPSLDMLLHHDQHGPDSRILAFDGERFAGLDGKRGSRFFDVENLERIALGFLDDVTPHDQRRHVGGAAAAGAGSACPVEVENSVGANLVVGEALAKRVVM